MTTTLEDFAAQHRLRLDRELLWPYGHPEQARRDGAAFIPGRYGQVYDFEDGQTLAVMVIGEHVSALRWGNARRACEAVGMARYQFGDAEGTLTFDPTRPAQVQAALKAIRAYRRAQWSPEQRAAMAARAAEQFRRAPAVE
jgi:hypothetical protein